MIITQHGKQFIKIQHGDVVIALDPPSKQSKEKPTSKFGATMVLSSVQHADMNGVETVTRGENTPFAVTGPGEYEIHGVVVRGLASKTTYGKKSLNTMYLITMENMKVCFLGALDTPELSPEAKELLDEIDVLFVPVSGSGTLSAGEAQKLAVKLEAKLVIPMNYDDKSLKGFLKEMGAEGTKPVEKLTLKPKDLGGKTGNVVVLKRV